MIADGEHNASHKRGSSGNDSHRGKAGTAGWPSRRHPYQGPFNPPANGDGDGDGDGPLRGFLPSCRPPTPQLASNLGKTANRRPTRPLDTCAVTPPSIIYDNSLPSAS